MHPLRTALLASSLLILSAARADETPAPTASVNITGSYQRSSGPEGSFGYCNGVVVCEDGRPLVCFGLNKRPKEKGRYTYVLLFKNGPDKPAAWGVRGKASSSGDNADDDLRVVLGPKSVAVAYQYAADEKTHALKSETVKVGGAELKRNGPRVFLVDLTQEKVTYRPVRVELPEAVPDFDDAGKKTWAATAVRAVDELCKKSGEVKLFLNR
jgi:hypothetical protein